MTARLRVVCSTAFVVATLVVLDRPAAAATPRVSVGYQHSCMLTASGRILCWGDNTYGQIGNGAGLLPAIASQQVPAEIAAGFTSIATGGHHTCGLQIDGTAFCWGANESGELGTGVTAAHGTSLPVRVATSTKFTSIVAGASHTCGLATDGTAFCWGSNGFGQLGIGVFPRNLYPAKSVPTQVVGFPAPNGVPHFTSLVAGRNHNCGIDTTGNVLCWGDNEYSQTGQSSAGPSGLFWSCNNNALCMPRPSVASASSVSHLTFTSLAAGRSVTCGVTAAGTAFCWGQYALGNGTNAGPAFGAIQVATVQNFRNLSAGDTAVCGTTVTNEAYCWGLNFAGQLGSGTPITPGAFSSTPVRVAGTQDYVSVTTGDTFGCGTTTSGAVRCWGANNVGQAGRSSTSGNLLSPTGVPGLSVASLRAGGSHACGIDTEGITLCWGANLSGQIGHGRQGDIPMQSVVPTPIARFGLRIGLRPAGALSINRMMKSRVAVFSQLASGGYHTCAIDQDGSPYCWGYDLTGAIGNGSPTHFDCRDFIPGSPGAGPLSKSLCVAAPTRVVSNRGPFTSITAGRGHTCAIGSNKVGVCWGSNAFGELARPASCASPACANPAPDVIEIPFPYSGRLQTLDGDATSTCAVTDHADLFCWGAPVGRTPTLVAQNFTTGKRVVSDGSHSCIVLLNDSLWCWGMNQFGEVGDGTNTASTTPQNVSGVSVAQLTLGVGFTCAIDGGSGVCWGLNGSGQLGLGHTANMNSPTPIVGAVGTLASIDAGEQHVCALNDQQKVFCWGSNQFGMLGNGAVDAGPTLTPISTPAPVAGGAAFP